MNLLLDTHVLIWAAEAEAEHTRLSTAALRLISDPSNTLWFSAASIWEVAIKAGQPRPDFVVDAGSLRRALAENGYVEAPVTARHAIAVRDLPRLHKDPFDRLLVAQARVEGLTLLTADVRVAEYGASILRV